MTSVTFVVPVFGRLELTAVCLRQLRRTCIAAADYDVDARAIVIGDDASVDLADELGFGTVRRGNAGGLGRKFNDGYQLACDPSYSDEPADFAIPCGSDDWFDHRLLERLPTRGRIGIYRKLAIVNETRTELTTLEVGYKTAAGPKIIPAELLARTRPAYRPAEEHRGRAIDASTIEGIKRALGQWPEMVNLDQHPLQIVDWKTRGEQLNTYAQLVGYRGGDHVEPFDALAGVYPADALDEMRAITPALEAAA